MRIIVKGKEYGSLNDLSEFLSGKAEKIYSDFLKDYLVQKKIKIISSPVDILWYRPEILYYNKFKYQKLL